MMSTLAFKESLPDKPSRSTGLPYILTAIGAVVSNLDTAAQIIQRTLSQPLSSR
jgi:hypothetical protein